MGFRVEVIDKIWELGVSNDRAPRGLYKSGGMKSVRWLDREIWREEWMAIPFELGLAW